jgi:hypothetical protein
MMPIAAQAMEVDKLALVDYWLSKLMFDLQAPAVAAEWRADRIAVLDRYALWPEIRAAVLADDIEILSRHVNAYLLRFYFAICGMSDAEFIARLRAIPADKGKRHG